METKEEITVRLDRQLVEQFLNECSFIGPNAEAVRTALSRSLAHPRRPIFDWFDVVETPWFLRAE